MKRPTRYDKGVIDVAADLLTNRLLEWAEAGKSERPEYFEIAKDLIDDSGSKNGYELARRMDLEGYSPDAELVEILDGAYFFLSNAYTDAVKQWVKGWNIKVPFALNDAVSILYQGKTHNGFVRSINEDEATCVVQLPELGHVESGLGTHGLVLNCEDIPQPASASALSTT